MKHFKRFVAVVVLALLIVATASALLPETSPQPAQAQQQSDKYDGDCTGHETAGRCADKCPLDTPQGTYHLQGYDKDTGAAVCGFTYYNECPYAAGYSATDPMCDKLGAEQQANQVQPPAEEFVGK